MVNYTCEICGKKFDRKSNWVYHTLSRKFPCKQIKKTEKKINKIESSDGSRVLGISLNFKNLKNLSDNQQYNQIELPYDFVIGSTIEYTNISTKCNFVNSLSLKNIEVDLDINFDSDSDSETNVYKNVKINYSKSEKSTQIICRYCGKVFLYNKNLNRHISDNRCEVIKLQKQQKENIFVNLLNEEKIVRHPPKST